MRFILLIIVLCSFILASCNINSYSVKAKLNEFKETSIKTKAEVPDDFIPRDVTIVSAGDSLTQGVGDSTKQGGYVPYLQKLLEKDKGIREAHFYNFGVKGNRSDQLLNKLETSKVKTAVKEADIVIVTIGGNDVMKVVRENFTSLQLKTFEKQKKIYEKNLKELLTKVREDNLNGTIVLVGLYNPFITWFADIDEINKLVKNWNQASQKILAQFDNTYFVEVDDVFREGGENLLYTDYFHPNDKGYELIARRVYDTLAEEAIKTLYTQGYTAGNEENEH